MPTQIQKLEAHAAHLLDAFIQLRERYAMLEPMLFSEVVTGARGSGRQARGFHILMHSLFLSCAQDIAKLTLDDDDRTPSLSNLIAVLTDAKIRGDLQERFVVWNIPPNETDPEVIQALRRMELREETKRRNQFDELYCEATEAWSRLSTDNTVKAFRTIRDKVSAHTEVKFVADKYQFIDIAALGIKWCDLRITINHMQRLVELVGILIRNVGFAWELLNEQLSRASHDFWEAP